MGACLINTNQRYRDKQNEIPSQALRTEIKASLAEKTLPQIPLKYTEQSKREGEQTAEEASPNDNPDIECKRSQQKIPPRSSSSLGASETGGSMSKRSIKQVILPSLKQFTNANSLQQRTQKQPTEKDIAENCSEDEEQKDDKEEPQIQTPFNRIVTPNMRGQGLTEADNRFIELTVNLNSPLRLNSVKFLNGSIYSGEWIGGRRQGQGILLWADGSRYEGQWRENCSWGMGKLAYSDKQIYEGQFVKNRREGKGKLMTTGSTYIGQWHNDHQEGQGVETWGKGEKYQGHWLAGWKSGYGELYFEDGSYYKGEFNGNEIHGYGRYNWNGSRVYQGKWEHNRMSGQGLLIWNNKTRQQGLFRNDKMHGPGVIIHPDGSISRGVFESGRKNGIFTQTDSLGNTKEVEYHMGKRLKLGQSHHRHRSNHSSSSKTARSTTQ